MPFGQENAPEPLRFRGVLQLSALGERRLDPGKARGRGVHRVLYFASVSSSHRPVSV